MPSPQDNRRLTGRLVAFEIVDLLSDMAHRYGGDLVSLLVFTGVWTANTAHLRNSTDRYAALHDIPPDSQRRPISDADLAERLCLPRHIQDPYVAALVEVGMIERRDMGLVVPSAVFTRAEMLAGTNDTYGRLIEIFARLRQAGVALGESETSGR
jgi:hypothetical protein